MLSISTPPPKEIEETEEDFSDISDTEILSYLKPNLLWPPTTTKDIFNWSNSHHQIKESDFDWSNFDQTVHKTFPQLKQYYDQQQPLTPTSLINDKETLQTETKEETSGLDGLLSCIILGVASSSSIRKSFFFGVFDQGDVSTALFSLLNEVSEGDKEVDVLVGKKRKRCVGICPRVMVRVFDDGLSDDDDSGGEIEEVDDFLVHSAKRKGNGIDCPFQMSNILVNKA